MKTIIKISLLLSVMPLLVLAYNPWWSNEGLENLSHYYPRFGVLIYLYGHVLIFGQLFLYLYMGIKRIKPHKIIKILHNSLFRKIIYIVIFAVAFYLRFGINNVPLLLDPDSTGYIEPALQVMNGKEFGHTLRSYPYPLFCLSILSVFKHIDAILYVQHILALITLLSSFFFFEQLISKIPILKKKEIVFVLGVISITTCFWFGNIILLEKTLRPEGIILPTLCLFFYLLYRYYHLTQKQVYSSLRLISLLLVALVLAYLHPRMSLAFYFTVFVLLVHFLYFSSYRIQNKVAIIIVSFLVSCVVITPEIYLVNKFDKTSKAFAYKQFYFSNLKGINEAIDLGESVMGNFDKNNNKEIITETLNNSPLEEYYPILGYDLDYAQYELFPAVFNEYNKDKLVEENLTVNRIVNDKIKQLSAENRKFTYQDTIEIIDKLKTLNIDVNKLKEMKNNKETYYFKTWFWLMVKKYPHKVVYKTGKQFIYFFFNPSITYLGRANDYIDQQDFNKESSEFQFLCKEMKYNPHAVFHHKFPPLLDGLSVIIGCFLKILMIIIVPYYFVQLIRKKLNLFDFLVGAFFLITVFTIAFLHTLDLGRYRDSFFPIVMLFVTLESYKLISRLSFNISKQ